MPEIQAFINVEIYCAKCSKGLCIYTDIHGTDIYVEPCKDCLDESYDEGFKDGQESME
jgi:hypothetical protein